jgi:hypothetical protein
VGHGQRHPYEFDVHGQRYEGRYLPAESDSGMFGGNSNWRGPVWFPINYLVLRGLLNLYSYYGDDFTIECPTGAGRQCTLFEVASEIGRRLVGIFLRDADGRRPVFGGNERFQTDPHWRRIRCSSTSTSTPITAPASVPATRRGGPASSLA